MYFSNSERYEVSQWENNQLAKIKRYIRSAGKLKVLPEKRQLKFDKKLKLYSLMTTKPEEVEARKQKEMEE